MALCQVSSKRAHWIALLFLSVGLGAVWSTSLTVYFVYKWRTQLEERFKRKNLPRLCGVIMVSLSVARSLRMIEVCLMFFSQRRWLSVLYHINSFVFISGLMGTLFALLIERLKQGFQHTVFSVPPRQVRRLYAATVVTVLLLMLLFILNDIHSVRFSNSGRLLIAGLAFAILILSMTLLIKLNFECHTRLTELVSCQAADSPPTRTSSRRNSRDDEFYTDNQPGLATGHTRDVSTMSVTEIAAEVTLSAITRARVSSFDSNYQSLLLIAVKSAVTCLWISLSFCLLFCSAILISVGSCEDPVSVVGYFLASVSFGIIGVTITLGMPTVSTAEYDRCCSKCSFLVQSVVAWDTMRKVFEIKQSIEERNKSKVKKPMDTIEEEHGRGASITDLEEFVE